MYTTLYINNGDELPTSTGDHGYSTNPPLTYPPPRNKGLIAGLIKGNQWLISPDHKAGYFWGGVRGPGGLVDQP